MNPRLLIFLLAVLSAAITCAQDISAILLFKASWYRQASAADPVLIPLDQGPYAVMATAYLSSEILNDPDLLMFISGMRLEAPPTGTTRGMNLDEGIGAFVFSEDAVSASALNGRFGAGNYTFTISSFLTGESSYNVPLSADAYPSTPKLVNYTASQAINASQDFTLQWTAFSGTGDREIWITVYELDTQSVVFDSGPLPGSSTSVVLPASTLQDGKDYGVDILFTLYTLSSSGTLPESYAGFDTHTGLSIRARAGGGPLDPSQISLARVDASGDLELTIACTAGRTLNVLGAPTLDGSWSTLQSSTPTASPAVIVVPKSTLGAQQFLRISQQ